MKQPPQKHQSLNSFLHARYLEKVNPDIEDMNSEYINTERRRLISQGSKLGIDVKLFKPFPSSQMFWVTPEVGSLFTFLLDLAAPKKAGGRARAVSALKINHVGDLRVLLIKALISCDLPFHIMKRAIKNYDQKNGFPQKYITQKLLSPQSVAQLKKTKKNTDPFKSFMVAPQKINTGTIDIDIKSYIASLEMLAHPSPVDMLLSLWQIDCGDYVLLPPKF